MKKEKLQSVLWHSPGRSDKWEILQISPSPTSVFFLNYMPPSMTNYPRIPAPTAKTTSQESDYQSSTLLYTIQTQRHFSFCILSQK